ncbi:murein hydrolase activator EnvC family protein [Streptomyces sp. NPDC002067]
MRLLPSLPCLGSLLGRLRHSSSSSSDVPELPAFSPGSHRPPCVHRPGPRGARQCRVRSLWSARSLLRLRAPRPLGEAAAARACVVARAAQRDGPRSATARGGRSHAPDTSGFEGSVRATQRKRRLTPAHGLSVQASVPGVVRRRGVPSSPSGGAAQQVTAVSAKGALTALAAFAAFVGLAALTGVAAARAGASGSLDEPVAVPQAAESSAVASGDRAWPVGDPAGPRPTVLRGWEPPSAPWAPGHRGVDLAAAPGATVRAAAPGEVAFAGVVAGRGVVTIQLSGSGEPPLRTTYEPVRTSVRKGDRVSAGQPVGVLQQGPFHCHEPCLHWGLLRGKTYLDPLTLFPPRMWQGGPSRLLPLTGVPIPSDMALAGDGPSGRGGRESVSRQVRTAGGRQPSPDGASYRRTSGAGQGGAMGPADGTTGPTALEGTSRRGGVP